MKKQKVTSDKESVLETYKNADASGKQSLEKVFGKDFFAEKNKKSNYMQLWNDFCKKNKLKVTLPYLNPKNSEEESENAYKMLINIIRIANKGWVPDFKNENEYKYYPWFYLDEDSGFAFSNASYDCTSTDSNVGSRLCFFSRQTAEEIAKAFLPIYEKYHM